MNVDEKTEKAPPTWAEIRDRLLELDERLKKLEERWQVPKLKPLKRGPPPLLPPYRPPLDYTPLGHSLLGWKTSEEKQAEALTQIVEVLTRIADALEHIREEKGGKP